jgi:hypothetical protein
LRTMREIDEILIFLGEGRKEPIPLSIKEGR